MTNVSTINEARLELIEALGEFKDAYFYMMKQWFKMQLSKKEFEAEIRKMLPQHQLHLHNRFILRLISNCLKNDDDTASKKLFVSSRNLKSEMKLKEESEEPVYKKAKGEDFKCFAKSGGFVAADVDEYLSERRTPSPALIEQQHYSAQDLFLPDLSMIHGRMMLCAWELGLDGAESAAAEVLVTATQHFLKNLLTAVFTRRKGFRVRENRFIYSIGTPMPNPVLRNYADPTEDFHATEIIRSNRESMDCQNWDKMKMECNEHEFPREMAILLSSAIKPTLENERIKQRIIFEMACSSSPGYERLKNPKISVIDIIEALNVPAKIRGSKPFGGQETPESTKPLLANQKRCLMLSLTFELLFLPPPRETGTNSEVQINRSIIASHSVFSVNMERLLAVRQHPSWDEAEGIILARNT